MREKIIGYTNYLDKLEGEYKEKFNIVQSYCTTLLSSYDENTRQDIMLSILDSFLSAQNDNIPIEKIIGNDISKFCEEACSEIPFKYKIKGWVKFLKFLSYYTIIMTIIEIFGQDSKEFNIFEAKTSFIIPTAVLVNIIIIILSMPIQKLIKKYKKSNLKKQNYKAAKRIDYIIYIPLLFFVGFLVYKVICEFDTNDLWFPMWINILLAICIILFDKILYKNDEKIKYIAVDLNEIADETIQKDKIKFKKKNEKRVKKGKEPITEAQFLEDAIKGCKNSKYFMIGSVMVSAILSFGIIEDYSIKIFMHQLLKMIIILFVEKLVFGFLIKTEKKMLEKYQYLLENNVKVEDWK